MPPLAALPFPPRFVRRAAFTLIELLVSMTVLVLLVVLVAQLTNGATQTTTASTRRIDADTQARDVFNHMAKSFAGMVRRTDVDCFFVKNSAPVGTPTAGSTNNDVMYFFSDVTGNFNDNAYLKTQASLSQVGYHVSNRGANATPIYPDNVMECVAHGLNFDVGTDNGHDPKTENFIFLTFATPTSTVPIANSTLAVNRSDYVGKAPTWDNAKTTASNTQNYNYIIADGVFRMEYCFLVKDTLKYGADTTPNNAYAVPAPPSGKTPWTEASFMTQIHPVSDHQMSMRQISNGDVAAVVVTLAAMDAKTRSIINSTQLAKIRSFLPDDDDSGTNGNRASIAKVWNSVINSPTTMQQAGIPPAVVSQIRVYQRTFYLPSPQ